jgi:hypothetical protein
VAKEAANNPPHMSIFANVYVNEIGRPAMMTNGRPAFPVGSVIVRESTSLLLGVVDLVVMVKRAKDFSPAGGDWEFILTDAKATNIQLREKTGSCQACHAAQKESDFVFRTYLPQFNPRRKQ